MDVLRESAGSWTSTPAPPTAVNCSQFRTSVSLNRRVLAIKMSSPEDQRDDRPKRDDEN
jgi:hypothetical protein